MAINLGNFGSIISERSDKPVAAADTGIGDALQKFGAFAGKVAAEEQGRLNKVDSAVRTAEFEASAEAAFAKGQERINRGEMKPEEFTSWYEGEMEANAFVATVGASKRVSNAVSAATQVSRIGLKTKVLETQAGYIQQAELVGLSKLDIAARNIARTDLPKAINTYTNALEGMDIPPLKKAEMIESFANDTTYTNLAFEIENTTSIAGANALISRLSTKNGIANLTQKQTLQALNAAQNRKTSLKAEYDRQKREREADASQEGSMYLNMLGSGLPISPQLQTQMANFTGNGSKAAKFVREGLANYGAIRAQQLSPFASQVADLSNLRAAVVNETNPERRITLQNRFDVLAKSYGQGAQAFKADSLQYAADVSGTVPPPIDLSGGPQFLASMRERANYVNRASATHGKPVMLMTANEAAQFVPMFTQLKVEDQADMLASLRKAGGDKAAIALAGSLSKENPTLGLAAYHAAKGGVTTSGRSTASIVLKGMKTKIDLPKDVKDQIATKLLDRYGESLDQDSAAFNQYRNAAELAYKALSAEEGDMLGTLNSGRAMSAATIAVGTQPVEINGRSVIPPIGRSAAEFHSSMYQGIAKIGRDVYGFTGSDLDKFITTTVLRPEGNETYGLYTKGSGATIMYPKGSKRGTPIILRGDK